MRRSFVKNILFVLAVNALIKPAWIFVIDRTVQNRVGHADYGTYQALFSLSLIFQILLDFGLNNYNSRLISRDPQQLKDSFSRMLSARIVLILLYSGLVMLTGSLLGYKERELGLLAGVMLVQALNIMVQYIRSNVAALHYFRTDGLLSVTDRFLMIFICGLLLFLPATAAHFRIEWFVYCQVGCYAAALAIAWRVLAKLSPVPFRFRFHTEGVTGIIRDSFPYALLIFLMSVYTRADMMLVERIAGKEQAGIYSSAYRLLDVGNIFGLMFANVLLPLFGRMLGEREDVSGIIRVSVNMLLPVSLIVAVAAFFYGTEIMHLLYPVAGVYDGQVFAWLMATLPAFCLMYVYSTLLTANGSLKLLNYIAAGGVAVNLVLNFSLIPAYGALGAGITACITQSLLAIAFIFFAKKEIHLPVHLRWIGALSGFLIILMATGWLASLIPLTWPWRLILYGCSSLLLMFVFRFVSVPALKQLFSKK